MLHGGTTGVIPGGGQIQGLKAQVLTVVRKVLDSSIPTSPGFFGRDGGLELVRQLRQ